MSEEPLYIRPAADVSADPADEPLYVADPYWDEALPSSRVPNLGHAILFVSFTGLLLFLSQLVALSLAHGAHASPLTLLLPKWELASMAATYILALASAFLIFPLFWERGFLAGIDWHGEKAGRLALRLISLGLSVGWCVQAVSSLIPMPKSIPMEQLLPYAARCLDGDIFWDATCTFVRRGDFSRVSAALLRHRSGLARPDVAVCCCLFLGEASRTRAADACCCIP